MTNIEADNADGIFQTVVGSARVTVLITTFPVEFDEVPLP